MEGRVMKINYIIKHIIICMCLISITFSSVFAVNVPSASNSGTDVAATTKESSAKPQGINSGLLLVGGLSVGATAFAVYLLQLCISNGVNSGIGPKVNQINGVISQEELPTFQKIFAKDIEQITTEEYTLVINKLKTIKTPVSALRKWFPSVRTVKAGAIAGITVLSFRLIANIIDRNAKQMTVSDIVDQKIIYKDTLESVKIKDDDKDKEKYIYRPVTYRWYGELKTVLTAKPSILGVDKNSITNAFKMIDNLGSEKAYDECLFSLFQKSYNDLITMYYNAKGNAEIDVEQIQKQFRTRYWIEVLLKVFKGNEAVQTKIKKINGNLEKSINKEANKVTDDNPMDIINRKVDHNERKFQEKYNLKEDPDNN